MSKFVLDERLQKDCILLLEEPELHFLLHRNAEVSWFILVPHTRETEFVALSMEQQQQLLGRVNQVAAFIQQFSKVDKLNIGMIGNVVAQMHIHVIGRSTEDAYWPDVVWGKSHAKSYSFEQQVEIRQRFAAFLQ